MTVGRASAVFGRRTCAILAAASAVLHAFMIGHAGTVAGMVLIVGMCAACLYCGYELWNSGALRCWLMVAVMNLAMVAIHFSSTSGHGHQHGQMSMPVPQAPTVMTVATVLSVVEAAVAAAVLCVLARGRGPLSPSWRA